MTAALRLRARGRVQRVGFRRYAQEVARELGLAGWVKNLPDGSIQIHVQGPPEKLEAFVKRLREAPAPIRVEQVLIREAKPEPRLEYFRIIYGPLEEELQEGFGAMQAIFMEYWHEFRDFRQEFRDYRQEFREFAKRMEERFNVINDKLTTIPEALVKESMETRRQLAEALMLLRQLVEKLLGEKAA